jgi:hypothetical protein
MSRNPDVPWFPYLLLGGLTLVTFGGPFAMLVVIRGGPSAGWPPDRPIEWITIGLVCGLAFALFVACVSIGWWYPGLRRSKKHSTHDPDSSSQSPLI